MSNDWHEYDGNVDQSELVTASSDGAAHHTPSWTNDDDNVAYNKKHERDYRSKYKDYVFIVDFKVRGFGKNRQLIVYPCHVQRIIPVNLTFEYQPVRDIQKNREKKNEQHETVGDRFPHVDCRV